MIRATTGGVMKTYRSNLMGSFINMNASRNTVLSQRNFNSYAEDPAAAAKAFRLRKSRMSVESQYSICADVHKKYEAAVACLQSNDDILCTKDGVYGQEMTTLTGTTLKMLNDPSGDARTQLSKALDQMSQAIIQTMNQKYGDTFIFAGADGHNAPFEIKENKLYYRGVPVDASIPNVWTGPNGRIAVTADGKTVRGYESNVSGQIYYLKMDNATIMSSAEYDKLYNSVPDVIMDTDNPFGDGEHPLEYDANGKSYLDPDYDGVGGYYMTTEDGTTESGKLISKQEYGEAVYRKEHAPQLLQNSDGSAKRVDANGNPDNKGEYYIVFDGDPQVIPKEEYDAAVSDVEKLKYLATEKYFVDIGLGFQEDEYGKLIQSTGFNASLNGLTFLGYGLDEDGDPKNLYSLVQKMRELADSVDSGTDWTTSTWEEFDRLVGKFEDAVSNYQTEFVNLDASTAKLKNQEELLSDNFYSLQEQYSDLEDVDMVDAITSFIWAEYCYNAALKVGNSILSESLMDYLS